ncbi:MAG TPA: hypothetical protein VG675_13095 [Bryobacteraceae bacterium]|nr:hypothetical protein [Bryobacteraceae bacterium]
MSRQFTITLSIGLLVVIIAVIGILYMQRGAHIDLNGQVLKVRTLGMDENSSVAVLDFRITNPADYAFVVRTVTVYLEDAAGNRTEGFTSSDVDAARLFSGYPLLGQKYNATLMMKDKIGPHATEDRMVAARFDVPEAKLEARKRLVVRIEDVDGPVAEISEK